MANMEEYLFRVDADTDRAVSKLKQITALMDQIERIRNKGMDEYSTTTQKDMDKGMRSMSQLTRGYKELDRELTEIQRKMREISKSATIPEGASKEQINQIEQLRAVSDKQAREALRQQKSLQAEYAKTLRNFRQLSSFQQNYSKNFKHIFSSNDTFNLPRDKDAQGNLDKTRARKLVEAWTQVSDGVSSKVEDIYSQVKEVEKLDRRNESLSRRAKASNYMSHQQASSFSADYATTRGDYTVQRENNLKALTDLGLERTSVHNRIKELEQSMTGDPDKDRINIDRKVAMQQTIESMDKERDARIALDRALQKSIRNMEEYNKRVQGVELKPERGTFKGMLYERAPAVGLALTGAMGAVFGGLYGTGTSVKRQIRDDVVSIGQRTNQDDWRTNVRDNALEAGLQDRLGFTGQQMLAFQNTYLSNRGFKDLDDLNTAMQSQAIFSRVTGMNADRTQQFFDSMFGSATLTGSSVTDIQNAFVGAIKQSGMEGREEDQLAALEGILSATSQGRTLAESDVMNLMGLQSILASSGVQSLRGEKGGQLLADLDQGIRQGIDDPMVRLAFGQGTKYRGIEGRWELRKQLEKGISDPENIMGIGRMAESFTSNTFEQNELAAEFIRNRLGVDATSEQVEGLMDLYRKGALTSENIDRVLQHDMSKGEEVSQEKLQRYQDSKESTESMSEAVWEKQAVNINDFGDVIRDANVGMKNYNAAIYAGIVALAALSAAALGTAASFAGARGVRTWARGIYRGGGRGSGRGGRGGPNGPGGPGGGIGGWFRGLFDPNVRKGGLPNTGPSTTKTPKTPPKGTSGIMAPGGGAAATKGMGRILGRAFMPLNLALGAGEILTAPEESKGRTTGEVAGGIGGSLGGAALGASIGSVVPVVGTAIGGILGGIVGGAGGASAGGWLGGKADKKSANKGPEQEKKVSDPANSIKEQVERENTTRKDQSESKRSDNISYERENLSREEQILKNAESILRQSRMQGGIFGTGVGGGLFGSDEGAPTITGDGNAEKIWNFLADKGLSSSAIAGIMGNLQQESGLDPKAPGGGLAQWIGGRKANLDKFAKSKGLSPDSLEAQLQFMWKEMQGGDSMFHNKLQGIGGISGLNKMSASEVAEFFSKYYERPGKPMMDKRKQYANDFYNQFGGAQMGNKVTTTAAKSNASATSFKIDSKVTVDVRGDEKVSDKIKDSADLKKVGQNIVSRIYGSMGYHARETRRT